MFLLLSLVAIFVLFVAFRNLTYFWRTEGLSHRQRLILSLSRCVMFAGILVLLVALGMTSTPFSSEHMNETFFKIFSILGTDFLMTGLCFLFFAADLAQVQQVFIQKMHNPKIKCWLPYDRPEKIYYRFLGLFLIGMGILAWSRIASF